MLAQPQSERCPVKSFKFYLSKLNPKCPWFFQTPNPYMANPNVDLWYKNCPVGEGTIGLFMKQISISTNLPKLYTNHKIRGTTASIVQDKFGLHGAAHVTHHRSYESLRTYLAKPTLQDKANYSNALFEHASSPQKEISPRKLRQNSPKPSTPKLKLKRKKKVTSTVSKSVSNPLPNQVVALPTTPKKTMQVPRLSMSTPTPPSSPDSQSTIIYTPPQNKMLAIVNKSPENLQIVEQSAENGPKVDNQISNLLQNVYKQAPAMFSGATFNRCTFNINLPQN